MALSKKQVEFYNAFISGQYREMMYGGAVGGGKTFLILGVFHELAQRYAGIRLGVIRATFPSLRANTIPSYKKLLQDYKNPGVHLTRSEPFIATYPNGSTIEFIAVNEEKDKDHDKIKGLELTMAAFDEANEITESAYNIMITRIGRWRNDEYNLPAVKILTCNPANNWVKTRFYDKWRENTLPITAYYLPALPHDNPFLSDDYLIELESLTGAAYQRFVLGNWDFAEMLNQLVSMEALGRHFSTDSTQSNVRSPKYIGVDVSRHGADKSILYFADEEGLLFYEEYKFNDLIQLKEIIKERMFEYGILHDNVGLDAIGIGWGVIDLLAQDGINIVPYQGSESALPVEQSELPEVLYNTIEKRRRTEANFLMQQYIMTAENQPYSKGFKDQALQVRYAFDKSEKMMRIETKTEQKARLGYSLDIWDAAVICNYIRTHSVSSSLSGSFMAISAVASKKKGELRRECGNNHRKYMTCVKGMVY